MDPSAARLEAGPILAPCFPAKQDGDDPNPAMPADEQAEFEGDGGAPSGDSVRTSALCAVESLDNLALAQLIGRVMRQDESALASLYEQLSGRVYAVALRITRRVSCAEEVMQDTFWQVWRQAPRFDPNRGSAIAWVMMMARSRALDAVRARSRDPVQSSQHPIDEEDPFPDEAADDPLDLLQAVRRDGVLHEELAKLDPLLRQLIGLAFFRGLTHEEIADHMGLPLGTVKSHVRRTLAALQSALGADFNQLQLRYP
ncbi:RNA polymerase sigma factor [Ideonella sp. A 288]|uniref:RNA polymerase sigma factor n=1 Tax=Ideonella sp. A 288 TaxID=1962181 RepID=UPI0018FE7619|nr:sigma-70 family RNA polymerase sigma factor [Ideonella sp. A 288]